MALYQYREPEGSELAILPSNFSLDVNITFEI